MSGSFHDFSYVCLFLLGVQNLCCKAIESIFSKELIFELDVKHVFHGVEFVWIQTFRRTKRDGLIKPFHVSIWVVQLKPVLESTLVLRMMLYLTLLLSKTKSFCWLMRLFLSNLGNLKSCIVMAFCILGWPAMVLTSLISPSNFVIMPFGEADLFIFILGTLEPELKKYLTLHSTNFQLPFDLV